MTKRELINLLEASDAPDNAGIYLIEIECGEDDITSRRATGNNLPELHLEQGEDFKL